MAWCCPVCVLSHRVRPRCWSSRTSDPKILLITHARCPSAMCATSKTSRSPSGSQMPQVRSFFFFSLTTNAWMLEMPLCVQTCTWIHKAKIFSSVFIFLLWLLHFFFQLPISSNFPLHARCVSAQESLSPLKKKKHLPSCVRNSILLSSSHCLSLSVSVCFPFFSWVCHLTFHSNALSLSISSSEYQCTILSICLVFLLLRSGPSAVIQLSHSVISNSLYTPLSICTPSLSNSVT